MVDFEAIREHYDQCFACGRGNPVGLHMDDMSLESDGTIRARFTPRPDFRGAGETLHGGVAATAIDEILVWAGIASEDVLTVTGTLDLRYRRPLLIGTEIVASARVDERRGRRLRISGDLRCDDVVSVEGSGLYLVSHTVDEILSR